MNRSIWKRMRSPSFADLVLVVTYAWFVRINLASLWRGDLSVLMLILQECCVIGLILTRRRAVAAAPWDSPQAILGWCGTLAPLFVRPAELAPTALLWIGAIMQGAGNVLALAGTLHLGRSFGIIAANRGIQTDGLYQVVRHPIYAAYLLAFGGYVLAHSSHHNTFVLFVSAGVQIARIHAEEHLLRADPCYEAYSTRVRHRLVPGIW